MKKIEQPQNFRSSDSWGTGLQWSRQRGAGAVWSCLPSGDPSCPGPSVTLGCFGNARFLPPTSCSWNSLSAAWGTLSVTFGTWSRRGFHRWLPGSRRWPPPALADRQPPGAICPCNAPRLKSSGLNPSHRFRLHTTYNNLEIQLSKLLLKPYDTLTIWEAQNLSMILFYCVYSTHLHPKIFPHLKQCASLHNLMS